MKPTSDKNINKLVAEKIAEGWKLEDRGKHLIVRHPEGEGVVFARSPSDRRAFYNTRAQIRRVERGRAP